jgi:hypothetical protein
LTVPLTVFLGDQAVAGYTRNVSDRGVYFYLDLPESNDIVDDFEFVLELPPDITLSTWCPIRCRGRLVRREQADSGLAGVAAEIMQYSMPQASIEAEAADV